MMGFSRRDRVSRIQKRKVLRLLLAILVDCSRQQKGYFFLLSISGLEARILAQ